MILAFSSFCACFAVCCDGEAIGCGEFFHFVLLVQRAGVDLGSVTKLRRLSLPGNENVNVSSLVKLMIIVVVFVLERQEEKLRINNRE